ncbi:hypothetical protein [Solibacillus ferritrahens]|uniref:hypothetical protein n=1 Tax=Solibacillus ferritrahens TaxID=3098620 RepID=UPI003009AFD3
MFNNGFQLTKFFISSFYSKPKQPMLKVVLIIAFFYLFLQLMTINIAIFYLGDTKEFIFYNYLISNLLVYLLVIYFSISLVFHYYEYGILTHLPIAPRKIIISKILSIIFVLTVVSAVIQIPSILLLGFKTKFTELIKLVLLVPISNILTILLILFILSLINSFRHYFVNKTAYLVVNITITFLITAMVCYSVLHYVGKHLTFNNLKLDFTTLITLKNSLSNVINQIYELVLKTPFIGNVLTTFTSGDFSYLFVIDLLGMIGLSALLFILIVKINSIHYFKNGTIEVNQSSSKKTKVYHVESVWANYFQRELWVINTEAYFKMQLVLGAVLSPILTLILLFSFQAGWISEIINITKPGYFEIYFAYAVLIMSCINNTSGTPFSREGKYYYLINSLPLNKKKIYFSKVFLASIPSGIAVIVSFIIFMLFGYMNMGAFLMMIIILMLVYCYNLLTPVFDMLNPSTEWENPSVAVKSNPNVLVSLLFGLPILVVVILTHFILLWAGFSIGVSTITIFLITVLITFCVYTWFTKFYFSIK